MPNDSITAERAVGGPMTGKLATALRSKIISGSFKTGDFLPSVRELTAERGLAHTTVYRALRQLAAEGWVSAEAGRGYRVLARGNDPDRGAPVAFVLTPQSHLQRTPLDDLRKSLLAGLQGAAAERDWVLMALEYAGSAEDAVLGRLRELKACGAILDTLSPALIAAVGRSGLPVVAVENWHEDSAVDAVVQDSFRGGFVAGSWLAARGHRRIGWIAPAAVSRQGSERFGGAAAALAERGIELAPELRLGIADFGAPDRVKPVREYLARPDRPEAILALWQGPTALVAQAARELGLVPGRDFDMVGWSTEEEYDSWFRPNFQSVPVPPAVVWDVGELARTAVSRLAERRANPKLPPITLKIPTRLRVAE